MAAGGSGVDGDTLPVGSVDSRHGGPSDGQKGGMSVVDTRKRINTTGHEGWNPSACRERRAAAYGSQNTSPSRFDSGLPPLFPLAASVFGIAGAAG